MKVNMCKKCFLVLVGQDVCPNCQREFPRALPIKPMAPNCPLKEIDDKQYIEPKFYASINKHMEIVELFLPKDIPIEPDTKLEDDEFNGLASDGKIVLVGSLLTCSYMWNGADKVEKITVSPETFKKVKTK